MLKRALAGVPALLLLPVLAACGGNNSSAGSADSTPATPTSSSGGSSATWSVSSPSSATSAAAGGGPCHYVPAGPAAKKASLPPSKPSVSGTVSAVIHTTEGDVPITLDAHHAPCTVNSFVSLARQKYFDDTPCHRLTQGPGLNVLQCGDPSGTGSGGPGYSFDDEITGHDTYPAGTVAMANAGPNTDGSQFFLCYADCSGLDSKPNYTVFGKISAAGMTTLGKVAKAGEDDANGPGDGHPKDRVKITSVSVGAA